MKRLAVLVSLLVLAAGSADARELHVYNWSDYLPDSVIEAFEARCECDVVYDVYTSNEEMLAKLQAGATGYDILVPTDYAVATLIAQDQLLPLDHDKIPNLKNIKPAFLDPSFDPGNRFSVPYAFGPTVLGFNAGKMEELGIPTDTWAAIFEPEYLEKVKGRVTVLDDFREIIGAALMYLGYSPNSTDRDQWEEAKALILRAKPYWAAFNASNYNTLLASGDVWLVHGYSMDIFQAAEEAADSDTGIEIGYAIPKEGAFMSTDNLVIHKSAPEPALAHEFIDFLLDGEQSAVLSNELGIGNPNAAAEPYIDAEILADPVLSPSGEIVEKLEGIAELSARDRRDLNRVWTEIKVR